MFQPHITIIILNTNRREDTLACLASLAQSSYANYSIMVLDNHSSDGSVEAIRERFPTVEIVPLRENLGYAGNNNVGLRLALERGADWVLVLNEDTILAEDCLSRLAAAGEAQPEIGMVGPLVYHHSDRTRIQSAGGRLTPTWQAVHLAQNQPDNGRLTQPRDVDWLSGCALMVRRETLAQIGLLDERFFYFWEETEWCLRAGRAGWRIVHVPQAHLWHKGVQPDYRPKPSVTYYGARNRFLAMASHRAPLWVWLVALWQTGRTLLSWTFRPKWKQMRPHRDALWQGLRDFVLGRWGMWDRRH